MGRKRVYKTRYQPGVIEIALRSLLNGLSVSRAAEEAGIHRNTIYNWMRTHPDFERAVQQARAEGQAKVQRERQQWEWLIRMR